MLETSQEYDVILFTRIDIGCSDFDILQNGSFTSVGSNYLNTPMAPGQTWFRKAQFHFKHIGAFRLRTFLEQLGYSVKVIDFSSMLSLPDVEKMLDKFITAKTKIVGGNASFGSYSPGISNVNKLFQKIKDKHPNITIVVGGQNSALLLNVLTNADKFVKGFGENALLALLEGKVKEDEKILDGTFNYGFPNDYLVKWKDEDCIKPGDVLPLETARGCIFKCKFCAFPLIGKKRNDHVGDYTELKDSLLQNYEKYGTTRYTITEETFNDNIDKLEELAKVITDLPFQFRFSSYIKPELLVARPEMNDLLIALGIEHANVGIESLNRETRKAVAKGYDYPVIGEALLNLKDRAFKAGFWDFGIGMNIICGLPHETMQSFTEGLEYLLSAEECDTLNLHRLVIKEKSQNHTYVSPIDEDPESYGYTIDKAKKVTLKDVKFSTSEEYNDEGLYWKNNKDIDLDKAEKIIVDWQIAVLSHNKLTTFPHGLNGFDGVLDRKEILSKYDYKISKIPIDEKNKIGLNFKQRVDEWYNKNMM